jgi:putative acetyltransferase
MNIRPETPADYAAITELNMRAFDERIGEPLVVTLLRHWGLFDPALSLVAETDGQIVGHVLFTPQVIRLLDQPVKVVCLAPIAVEPDQHGKGIGSALIAEGHRIAREKGYTLAFLIGHDTYYPRFGYKTGVYGGSSVELTLDKISTDEMPLQARLAAAADTPALRELWVREEGGVDFSVDPGASRLDWTSPNPNIRSAVYTRDGVIVGYTRIHRDEPDKPRMFLAADDEAARAIAAMLIGDQLSLTLPLHPYSRSAGAFPVKPKVDAWNAAMACSLAPGPFDDYYAQLQEGKRLPGRVIWPVAFDLA